MAIALIVTAGAADANAYVDLVTVQTVAAYRGAPGVAFLGLAEDQQIQAIATTALSLDALCFAGSLSSDTQAMAFPRDGNTTIPSAIVRANTEEAISKAASFLDGVSSNVLAPDTQAIKRVKAGPVEVEFQPAAVLTAESLSTFALITQRLLAPLLCRPAAAGWGVGVVTRGS